VWSRADGSNVSSAALNGGCISPASRAPFPLCGCVAHAVLLPPSPSLASPPCPADGAGRGDWQGDASQRGAVGARSHGAAHPALCRGLGRGVCVAFSFSGNLVSLIAVVLHDKKKLQRASRWRLVALSFTPGRW
jgi:hypothetical protein